MVLVAETAPTPDEAAVRDIHRRTGIHCQVCGNWDEIAGVSGEAWPCPTIQALDGAALGGSAEAGEPERAVSGRTVDAHLWAAGSCPSVYGNNAGDSQALVRTRDAIAEHFASVEGSEDVEPYDAVSYELATVLERAGLLAAVPASVASGDDTQPDLARKLREMAGHLDQALVHHREYNEMDEDIITETARRLRALAEAGAPAQPERQPRHGDLVDRWLSDYRDNRADGEAAEAVVEELRDEWIDAAAGVRPLRAAPAQPDDETAHGYVLARITDATAHHGDRVLTLWADDVHRTLTAASDREVEDVDDEHGGWEVYEVRRVTIPRAALAGAADTEEPTDA